jgi:hypothetical protein
MRPNARFYNVSPGALRPLMDTFWSSQGWRRPPQWPSSAILRRASDDGVRFDELRTEDHDSWVRAALAAVRPLTAAEVSEAFLASLSTRRLDLRSALGSYAVARFLTEHEYQERPGHGRCAICGQPRRAAAEAQDLNVLSFERFKWGGVRTDHIEYIAFDLEQFARAPRVTPTEADVSLGQQLIDQLRQLPADTTAAQAPAHLKMIDGNKAERDIILGILGVCGILQTTSQPGYSRSFVPYCDRQLPARRFVDQHYPACWWTAADGVNTTALSIFLPKLT